MKIRLVTLLGVAWAVTLAATAQTFRPPSVPLVTFDPYLSIWSGADHLTDKPTEHWTKHVQSLVSLIRIDGQVFRLMGVEPAGTPPLRQTQLQITPTRSVYDFENTNVHVQLSFMRPALPEDLNAMAMPLTYLTWEVRAVDGKAHAVQLYDSSSSEICVNSTREEVVWQRELSGALTVLRAGTVAQPVLASAGDDHRINWGYVYATARTDQSVASIGANQALLRSFVTTGQLSGADDPRMPRPVNDHQPVLAFAFDLGSVAAAPVVRQVIVAYDEIGAIKYFGQALLPFWKRNGATAAQMLSDAAQSYATLGERCVAFDSSLMTDATLVGGAKYAQMCALAYRQCAAGCGLAADGNNQPLFFTKENTSNGDIATVDVIYPMDPQWLLLSPTLAKASLVPILTYASTWHWKFPNAPHDLGTYPIARGRDDGGEGMPVEESGNMLLLCDAVAQADGKPDFVTPWWPKLTQWANYLRQYGLDPEEQLCTDDFMGHLAHNANLSIKAILGLAAYGDLCRMRGDTLNATAFQQLARADAAHWMRAAADGDHYRLAFDKTNSWSQKYNLVWDRILGLNIFPPAVAAAEVAFYKTRLQPYGLPLDSRTMLTKSDWTVWSASLATDEPDFEALVSPIYDYLNKTTARSPFVDSYLTDDIHSDGMHARPVIGGVFIRLMTDRDLWRKWASADKTALGVWAPLPGPEVAPVVTDILATSQHVPSVWRYTTNHPAAGWMKPGFNDARWKQGEGSFGTRGTPGAVPHTIWNTSDIWLRREITLPGGVYQKHLQFWVDHDEDVEIYVNGVLAATESGYTTEYVPLEIRPAALQEMHPGATILLAAHCHQTYGGQNIDIGLVDITDQPPR